MWSRGRRLRASVARCGGYWWVRYEVDECEDELELSERSASGSSGRATASSIRRTELSTLR
jgi:hypothetical protein